MEAFDKLQRRWHQNGLFSLALSMSWQPKVNRKGQGTYSTVHGAEAKTQKSGTKESKGGEDSDLVKKWQEMPGKH